MANSFTSPSEIFTKGLQTMDHRRTRWPECKLRVTFVKTLEWLHKNKHPESELPGQVGRVGGAPPPPRGVGSAVAEGPVLGPRTMRPWRRHARPIKTATSAASPLSRWLLLMRDSQKRTGRFFARGYRARGTSQARRGQSKTRKKNNNRLSLSFTFGRFFLTSDKHKK